MSGAFRVFIFRLVLTLLLDSLTLLLQSVAINSDGSAPDSSAVLDINPIAGGLLIPGMTTAEMSVIPDPAQGLVMFVADAAVPGICYNSNTKGTPFGVS